MTAKVLVGMVEYIAPDVYERIVGRQTSSATWSRSSGLDTTAVVGNGDANGAKGLVTAGVRR